MLRAKRRIVSSLCKDSITLRYALSMNKRFHRHLCSITLLCAFFLNVSQTAALTVAPFADMTTSWYGYQEAVTYLKNKGSIGGYPDGLFHPQETVNRAEFLKLVFRSKGDAEPVTDSCFA